RSRAVHYENLRRARELRNERMEARSLGWLGAIAVDEGQVEDAISMLRESIRICHEVGDHPMVAANLLRFAHALAVEGRAEAAALLLSSSVAMREKMGGAGAAWAATRNERTLTAIRAQLDE